MLVEGGADAARRVVEATGGGAHVSLDAVGSTDTAVASVCSPASARPARPGGAPARRARHSPAADGAGGRQGARDPRLPRHGRPRLPGDARPRGLRRGAAGPAGRLRHRARRRRRGPRRDEPPRDDRRRHRRTAGAWGRERPDRPAFVLHDHRKPRPHFDLRLEQDGVLRSWALPKGLPTRPRQDRLAIAVDDHAMDHLTYEDADKSVADTGWWEDDGSNERRLLFTLHGRAGSRALRADPHRQRLAAAPHQGPAGPGTPDPRRRRGITAGADPQSGAAAVSPGTRGASGPGRGGLEGASRDASATRRARPGPPSRAPATRRWAATNRTATGRGS